MPPPKARTYKVLRAVFFLKRFLSPFFLSLALILSLLGNPTQSAESKVPHWVADLPVPQNQPLYLVVKGVFSSQEEAKNLQKFIQQLMTKYPGDGLDITDRYEGLAPGQFVVGTLFDSKDRAQWWIDFSYRNRKIAKGTIQQVQLKKGKSELPYMPSAYRSSQKQLLTEQEALAKVKALPDINRLAKSKKLQYKFTDYPRNGDLRYEIEVLEDRGKRRDGLMVDFIMVSALNGDITERLSEALAQKSSR